MPLSAHTDEAIDDAVKAAGLWVSGEYYPDFGIYDGDEMIAGGGGPNSGEMSDQYDRLVYDGARFFAEMCKGDARRMYASLIGLGANSVDVNRVIDAMQGDQEEILYRGAVVDEGVIEAIKDALRPLAGF